MVLLWLESEGLRPRGADDVDSVQKSVTFETQEDLMFLFESEGRRKTTFPSQRQSGGKESLLL